MSDNNAIEEVSKTVYSEEFGINTFRREICAALGDEFWNSLCTNLTLPRINTERDCKCRNMFLFMRRFEEMADSETVKDVLYRVRHGLKVSQFGWARDNFLKTKDIDLFLKQCHDKELENFIRLNRDKELFYGDDITDSVLEFIKNTPEMLAPVRRGNKLYLRAYPANMQKYLDAEDYRMKRYYACHCPFAKESILSDEVVSPTLCNCSLGHVMTFVEAFLGRPLEGKVLHSLLNGDLTCEYEITIPDDIMEEYGIS